MTDLIVAAEAQFDLDSIAEFIARDSLAAAEQFIDRLNQTFERLRQAPGVGSPRNELMRDLRGRAFGSYIIYYRMHAESLEILRVVHSARDQTKIFDAPPAGSTTQ